MVDQGWKVVAKMTTERNQLELVALSPDEGSQDGRVGGGSGHGDQARGQSQVVLADVPDTGDAKRDAQQLAGGTGITFISSTLVRARSTSENRLDPKPVIIMPPEREFAHSL